MMTLNIARAILLRDSMDRVRPRSSWLPLALYRNSLGAFRR
jgi:hypothetical protein